MTISTNNAADLAQAILDHPVRCPSWCNSTEHPLDLGEHIHDCSYFHQGWIPVDGFADTAISTVDVQTIEKPYEPVASMSVMCKVAVAGGGIAWQPMFDATVDQAEALGKALIEAANKARQS